MGEETESLLISFTLAHQGHRRTLQLLFVAPRSGNLCSSLEPSFVGDFEQVAQSQQINYRFHPFTKYLTETRRNYIF